MIRYYDYEKRLPNAKDDILALVRATASSGEFILKSAVEEFEGALCAHSGASHAVCVSSGTFAMALALQAAGVGPGDEVITPAYSYVASASAIKFVGAVPVFVDVRPDDFTLCPAEVAKAVTTKTRACIGVHLFMSLADMAQLRDVLPRSVFVLEDAATAFGATHNGVSAGAMGDAGVLSFYPAKPLGGLGDAGAVLTNDPALATKVRMLRNHGQDGKVRFHHQFLGYNSRMDDLNARWLLGRMKSQPAESERRRALARMYDDAFAACPDTVPQVRTAAQFAPHAYVIRTKQRDALRAHLKQQGVETKVHFPATLPDQPAFSQHKRGDYPVSETLAKEVLALPLSAHITDHDLSDIAASVVGFFK